MRVLQMLNWYLRDVQTSLDIVASRGFDAIQINPIQPLKDDRPIVEWWMSYQTCGFSIGNQYGSKEDLINLCFEAKKRGIAIIADVVCNHTAGLDDGSLFPHAKVDNILKSNPNFWKKPIKITDWHNRYEVVNYCMGLPGLETRNYDLQTIIISFLNELIDCGVSGFRFDAAKSIALPEEGCDFWPRILYSLKKYGLIIYGEVIFENKELIGKYSRYMKVLTNCDASNPESIVKFVESHDSYLDFGYTKIMPDNVISNYYKSICQHYANTLYYARPFSNEWQSEEVQQANKYKIKSLY